MGIGFELIRMKEQLRKNWSLFLIASVTLGLAPFNPPHIVGKIQWILGGNSFSGEHAMQGQDWFDVFAAWNTLGIIDYFCWLESF